MTTQAQRSTPRYAQETEVTVEKSQAEIRRILKRYGANEFVSGESPYHVMTGFKIKGLFIRITITLPDPNSEEFAWTKVKHQRRTPGQQQVAYDQAVRQRWRALRLIIQAKLEAVEMGITTLEQEFMAFTLLPDGRTVGQFILPQIAAAYSTGKMPALMPGLQDRGAPDGKDN